MSYLLVFIGGGLGSLLRFLISFGFQKTNLSLPWATFIANIGACLIFAATLHLAQLKPSMNETLRYLLLIGFCGGLSTFSTFSYENYLLIKQGWYLFVVSNVLLTTILCISIFYWLAR